MKKSWMFWKKKKPLPSKEQEEVIQKVLETYEMKELEYLKSQEELSGEHTFSPEFEQKMDLLFHNYDTGREQNDTKRTHSFLRIPKVAVAAVCMFMVTIVFVGIRTEAIPFPKFNYILRKDEDSYEYLLEQESHVKDFIEEKFAPSYIPVGFQVVETVEINMMLTKNLQNEKGEKCIFQQFAKDVIVRADEISKEYKEMILGESRYYFMDRNTFKRLIWYDERYQFVIRLDAPIEEIIKMAQSIEIQ